MFERFFHRTPEQPAPEVEKPVEKRVEDPKTEKYFQAIEEQKKELEKEEAEKDYGKFSKAKEAIRAGFLGIAVVLGGCSGAENPADQGHVASKSDLSRLADLFERRMDQIDRELEKGKEEKKSKKDDYKDALKEYKDSLEENEEKPVPKKVENPVDKDPFGLGEPIKHRGKKSSAEKREITYPTAEGLSKALGGREVVKLNEGDYIVKMYGSYFQIKKEETLKLMQIYFRHSNSPQMRDRRFGKRGEANHARRQAMIDEIVSGSKKITKQEAEKLIKR